MSDEATGQEIVLQPIGGEVTARGGRPTKYLPEYCEAVENCLDGGRSFQSFAAQVGVCRATLNVWAEAHPEFGDAMRRAKARATAWWEERLCAIGEGKPGDAKATMFALKNLGSLDWQDKQEIDHTVRPAPVMISGPEADL